MLDGRLLTFEVFGLQADVFTMIDRETGTIWTHFDGKAFEGPLDSARLGFVPLPQMTWAEWKKLHPDTEVLSPDTPFSHRYLPVRIGRFSRSEDRFGDDRLESNALVVGVEVAGQFKGYSVEELQRAGGLVNDVLADSAIVVMYDARAQAGLAYSSVVDGRVLRFYNAADLEEFELRDEETDSVWDGLGTAVAGPMTGAMLELVRSFITEWYGWSEYHPETDLFQASP